MTSATGTAFGEFPHWRNAQQPGPGQARTDQLSQFGFSGNPAHIMAVMWLNPGLMPDEVLQQK